MINSPEDIKNRLEEADSEIEEKNPLTTSTERWDEIKSVLPVQ